jgi:peroxiredoxin
MALTYTPAEELGTTCPDFSLPAVDGKIYSRSDFCQGRPFLVMFICNHCPYVKAIEDRLIELGHQLNQLKIPLVAICSNDEDSYPEDNFAHLKQRWLEKNYPFPYLHDKTQHVAKAFGAVCTPDFFLYDSQGLLQYRGRLDDSWKDPTKVTRRELLEAAQCLLEKRPLPKNPTPSMGCSIKWIK